VTFKIEILPGERIMIITLSAEYSVSRDLGKLNDESREMMDNAEAPLFCIMDFTLVSLTLNDIIGAANTSSRGQEPIMHHRNMLAFVAVTPNRMLQLAAKGLRSVTFGNVNALAFETMEEALAYVRSQLAE
jgi:hypothetical protein